MTFIFSCGVCVCVWCCPQRTLGGSASLGMLTHNAMRERFCSCNPTRNHF